MDNMTLYIGSTSSTCIKSSIFFVNMAIKCETLRGEVVHERIT